MVSAFVCAQGDADAESRLTKGVAFSPSFFISFSSCTTVLSTVCILSFESNHSGRY